jgi:hypothetical protein
MPYDIQAKMENENVRALVIQIGEKPKGNEP